MKYSRKETKRKVALAIAAVVIGVAAFCGHYAQIRAEEGETDAWIMCKPGGYVNLRMGPDKGAREVGWLECGDRFTTDGRTKDGFVHCLDRGDCDCWVWAGNVVFEEPEIVGEKYVVVAKTRVACRRWIDGPQIAMKPWILNGTEVDVFVTADGWACTSRGYIRTEWLEVDPR